MKLIVIGASIVIPWLILLFAINFAFGQAPPAPGSVDYQAYATLIRQQRDSEAQAKNDALVDNAVMRQEIAADQAKEAALRQYWADYVAGLKAAGPAAPAEGAKP